MKDGRKERKTRKKENNTFGTKGGTFLLHFQLLKKWNKIKVGVIVECSVQLEEATPTSYSDESHDSCRTRTENQCGEIKRLGTASALCEKKVRYKIKRCRFKNKHTRERFISV